MSFGRTPHELAGTQVSAVAREESEMRSKMVIAYHTPDGLRNLAEIAAVFDAPGLHAGTGAILAYRSSAAGYPSVEYDVPGPTMACDIVGGSAQLSWRAMRRAIAG